MVSLFKYKSAYFIVVIFFASFLLEKTLSADIKMGLCGRYREIEINDYKRE